MARPLGARALWAVVLVAAACAGGCVTRTFTVTSEPAGAEVRLDGVVVGTTPYTETFLSYGVREVDLRLDGHVRDVREFQLERPWWQYFPFDVFADLLWPSELNDDHALEVELLPRGTATGSWAQARQAYADFLAVRRYIHGRELLFSGRTPRGEVGQEPEPSASDEADAPASEANTAADEGAGDHDPR